MNSPPKRGFGGNQKTVITAEIFTRLRVRVAEEAPKYESLAKVSELLTSEFAEFSPKTLTDYVVVAYKATDFVAKLYLDKKISLTIMIELARGSYDKATQDFLAREVVERKMLPNELIRTKQYLRLGSSMSEALKKAMGEIPAIDLPSKQVKRTTEAFSSIVDEIGRLSSNLRAKIAQAIEVLPITTLDKGKIHHTIFEKVYFLRHFLKENHSKIKDYLLQCPDHEDVSKLRVLIEEQLEFVDGRVQQYLDEIVKYVSAEQEINSSRRRNHGEAGRNDGSEPQGGEVREALEQEGGHPGLPEDGEALPH